MAYKYSLEVLAIIAVLVFCGLFLVTSYKMGNAEFTGSDAIGAEKISELAGVPVEEMSPLLPQWVPPGGEIGSGLFALQAAAGGIMVGLVFGYWIGQKKGTKNA